MLDGLIKAFLDVYFGELLIDFLNGLYFAVNDAAAVPYFNFPYFKSFIYPVIGANIGFPRINVWFVLLYNDVLLED